jgi:predicted RNase H-like HicB family nuclease
MRYTVLLLPESDPEVYVAYVPVLGVTTEGRTFEEAVTAAHEAATLAVRGLVADGEEVPTEPAGAVVASVDVPVPSQPLIAAGAAT